MGNNSWSLRMKKIKSLEGKFIFAANTTEDAKKWINAIKFLINQDSKV